MHVMQPVACTLCNLLVTMNSTILTFADAGYSYLLLNSLTHRARTAPWSLPPLVAHCLDDVAYARCAAATSALPAARGGCVRAPPSCCSASRGLVGERQDHGRAGGGSERARALEALLVYKLRAVQAQLRRTGLPVIMLDADALVTHASCYDRWLAYPEELVTQVSPLTGCPRWVATRLGTTVNTGASLWRPAGGEALLERALRLREVAGPRGYPYLHHCYEQELVNSALHAASPTWLHFPRVLALSGPPPMRVRLLNFTRWFSLIDGKPYGLTLDDRLGYNSTTAPPTSTAAGSSPPPPPPLQRARFVPAGLSRRARDTTCLIHVVGKKSNATWRARKLWYL